jgi:N-formylglutamate amidohydrolase
MLRAALLMLIFAATALGESKPKAAADYIVAKAGTLPIILSAPHGGRMPIEGGLVRRGVGVAQFTTVLDGNTDELTLKIAAALEKKLGAAPFYVVAKFERKYADANRPAVDAYESDAAKPVYELYHTTLGQYRDQVKKEYTSGLVLDIHGQGAEANTIFRGTASGKSVKHLVDRHGEAAILGPKSLFGQLRKREIVVHPEVNSKDREDRRFNGGYIVQTYGSADGGAIDALQLEIGGNLRTKAKLDSVAADIAAAIADFAKDYLDFKRK